MNTPVVYSEAKRPGLSSVNLYSAEFESVKNHLHSTCYHVQPNNGIAVLFVIHATRGREHISPLPASVNTACL